MAEPGVGDPAPLLRAPAVLADGSEGVVDLSELRGSAVVVAFYPADDSPVCTRQLNAYTQGMDRFAAVDAVVVGVSPQGLGSHRAFAHQQGGFAFPLLADESKDLARAWGVLGPLGFYRRSAFVVDAEGILRYAHRATAGLAYDSVDRLVEAVARAR